LRVPPWPRLAFHQLVEIHWEIASHSTPRETTYKVHLDGYDNTDHWTGKSERQAADTFSMKKALDDAMQKVTKRTGQ
jgi:hypothetical protein